MFSSVQQLSDCFERLTPSPENEHDDAEGHGAREQKSERTETKQIRQVADNEENYQQSS
jgi:hypothetical protein